MGPPVSTLSRLGGTLSKRARWLWTGPAPLELSRAMKDAEKVVGYPTSFMNLRFWLSDEIANVAVNMRKLIGTKHPLVEAAKDFIFDGKDTVQARGLIVLLISKAAGLGKAVDDGCSTPESVHTNQRSLAEISEMMHTATVIHRGVADISAQPAELAADMEYGNKLAILSGDYLLAKASTGLALLNNTLVVEAMACALANMSESEFWESKNLGQATVDSWEKLTYLSSGSLLSKSCFSALLLAGHDRVHAEQVSLFGVHLSLARQLADDVFKFRHLIGTSGSGGHLLPHILYNRYHQHHSEQLPVELTHADLGQNRALWDDVNELSCRYTEAALESLKCLEQSDARTALENLVRAVVCMLK